MRHPRIPLHLLRLAVALVVLSGASTAFSQASTSMPSRPNPSSEPQPANKKYEADLDRLEKSLELTQ